MKSCRNFLMEFPMMFVLKKKNSCSENRIVVGTKILYETNLSTLELKRNKKQRTLCFTHNFMYTYFVFIYTHNVHCTYMVYNINYIYSIIFTCVHIIHNRYIHTVCVRTVIAIVVRFGI